jgi:hypothetical protein
MGKGGVECRESGFVGKKRLLLVTDEGCKTRDFDIEAGDFFTGALHLEVLVHQLSSSRGCPTSFSYVFACIGKEVEVGEKNILNDCIP